MDRFLIDYLKSGRAWVLIGSGPSSDAGYPSWEQLASFAIETIRTEKPGTHAAIEAAMHRRDFPKVFEEAKTLLGGPRLLQVLEANLIPSRSSGIYKTIAKWPVSVYLTTNYDDEIQRHLATIGEAYRIYSNSADHLAYLLPDFQGAIVKLHGDLRSESGLILTTSQYHDITESPRWDYWRTKMTSVFQMNRIVVIGHSLSDQNIRHVLAAAKQGSGVHQPICWLAPDVPQSQVKEFLEKYRIRVISYDNRDGGHKNLARLIEQISEFVPARTSIHIQKQIAALSRSPLGNNAAAPGFYVFNKLSAQNDYEEKRLEIILAAIQSTIPTLASLKHATLDKILEIAGWPKDFQWEKVFVDKIRSRALDQGLLAPAGDDFKVGDRADSLAHDNKIRFEHMRDRFKSSLQLRAKKNYPALNESEVASIANDIESSLSGYFREGGLSLATTLFSRTQSTQHIPAPSSIVKFITESSARYTDLLMRQAFCDVSIDAFVHAESAEREYLGRISQGFFSLHALGAFGDVAVERLTHAKQTVWIIDSNAQIPSLALAAPTNPVFVECFSRLRANGVRLFTTEGLFDETLVHLWFARKVIKDHGPSSPSVLAAAMGEAPYRKSNQFLEGFIRWQAAGNQCDWESYLFQAFGARNPNADDAKKALNKLGIEVIPFQDWPGFSDSEFAARDEYTEKIRLIREGQHPPSETDIEPFADPDKKAQPEAEALIIVNRERSGQYHMLSPKGEKSSACFISHTSILNTVDQGSKITWQPEAFLRFASTLSFVTDAQSADRAFETLLWGLAQSGLSLIDEKMVMSVFGGVIDQATLNLIEQRQLYHDTIEMKYGESIEAVLNRLAPSNRPVAAIQLLNEMAQEEAKKRKSAEVKATSAEERAKIAERKLRDLDHFRKKMEAKQARGQHKSIKQKAKAKKKKK